MSLIEATRNPATEARIRKADDFWTDDKIATLRRLWPTGLTAAEIAKHIPGASRGMVNGKGNRLGLNRADGPSQPKRSVVVGDAVVVLRPGLTSGAQPVPVQERFPTSGLAPGRTSGVSMLALNNRTCRWPIGDPKSDAFCFCGVAEADNAGGVVYCRFHASKAITVRESKAA